VERERRVACLHNETFGTHGIKKANLFFHVRYHSMCKTELLCQTSPCKFLEHFVSFLEKEGVR
jgi:hypothetical protein